MKRKKSLDFKIKDHCNRCGSFELKNKKSGATVCKNCGLEEYFDEKQNILYTKIKVNDKFL